MNREELYYFAAHPEELSTEHLSSIENLIQRYPYFQSAHLLYLYLLKKTGHLRFNKQLRISASYITDRSVLFELLESIKSEMDFSPVPPEKKDILTIRPDRRILDQNVEKEAERILQQLNAETGIERKPGTSVQETQNIDAESEAEVKVPRQKKATKKPELPKLKREIEQSERNREKLLRKLALDRQSFPDYFDESKDEENPDELSRYFEAYLLDTVPESKDEENKDSKVQNARASGKEPLDLIDRFIANQPKISRINKDTAAPPSYKESDSDLDSGFITETLAKIYLKQKHYEKAIHAYKNLSLKYPEKNIYFADRIREIEKLKNTNT